MQRSIYQYYYLYVHAYMHIAILLYNKLLIHESAYTVIRIYYNTVFDAISFSTFSFGLPLPRCFLGSSSASSLAFFLPSCFSRVAILVFSSLILASYFRFSLTSFPLSCHAIAAFTTRRKKSEISFSCLVPASGNFTWATFFYKYS